MRAGRCPRTRQLSRPSGRVSTICIFVAAVLLVSISTAAAKTERTFYTPDKLQNMRDNIATHDWARALKISVIARADRAVAVPCEDLAGWVRPPAIPRAAYVHESGCPKCGLAARKYGTYPWIITPEKPYKVECPSCHSVFPSNDFQAFLDSGMKDRDLLTGDYPDDGWGWTGPDDPHHKYWFVAYYNHWLTWKRPLYPIRDLARAYLYTDDARYAHKCAVLLWQLAAYYPDYDYAKQSRRGTEFSPNYNGRLLYHTWETQTVSVCSAAYDAIFPALTGTCPELEQFTGRSMARIRQLIEEQLLRSMAAEIVNETGYICGNYGSHQVGLLQIAATLKDTPGSPSSEEMIRWTLDNDEYKRYVFMPIQDAIHNIMFRDGVPFESPDYNRGWIGTLTLVAEMLLLNGVDIYAEPRFKKLYDWPLQMLCAGHFTPALGDSGNMSNYGTAMSTQAYVAAFRRYRDPLYARALLTYCSQAQINDIFSAPINAELKQAAAKLPEGIGYSSRHLAAYGWASLQNGNPAHPVATSLFYGRFIGHTHRDKMQLDIYAEGASMIPDFGYPETCNSNDPRKEGFFNHVIAHNTVMVDASDQAQRRGRCLAYDTGPVCQYMEAQNDGVYPRCDAYRRSVALVETSPDHSYVIDIFRVSGGSRHDWLVHGTQADFESNLSFSPPRKEGTLAGPDVKYGYFYDDEKLRDKPYGSVSYSAYKGSGFQFLYNVQEASLTPAAWARWNLVTSGESKAPLMPGNAGAFLKAFLIGEDEHIFVCDARPQQNTKRTPDTVKYLIRRRTGEDLTSTFVTVFEPGANESLISAVERIPTDNADLVALRVRLKSGHTHYYFNATAPVPETQIAGGIRFAGQVGHLALDPRGGVEQAYIYNATLLATADWRLEGQPARTTTITSCDYRANTVTLADAEAITDALTGRTVAIDTRQYGASFVVREVLRDGRLTFGDQSPIVGRLVVKETDGKLLTLKAIDTGWGSLDFPIGGMTLTNEAFERVGKLTAWSRPNMALEKGFAPERLTDADGDGVTRAYIMEYGIGDTVQIPTSARYERR